MLKSGSEQIRTLLVGKLNIITLCKENSIDCWIKQIKFKQMLETASKPIRNVLVKPSKI